MTVRRIMGSETEFGVLAQGQPDANATVLSTRVVTGYASWVARRRSGTARAGAATRGAGPGGVVGTGWDYGSETPLADARGFTVAREDAHPSQLTDEAPELTAEQIAAEAISESALYTEDMDWRRVVMNTVIPNGARVYVDHSHPEYSSPEVTSPRDALTWDAAGDVVAHRAVQLLAEQAAGSGSAPVNLYKNNTDNKSVSYGAHENYTVDRAVPFERITAALLPFFASRQVVCGAGRVGLGVDGSRPGFQLSQRADFFERTVGLETTIHRPMVNTRDEPHADDSRYRRLHVIIGDANLSHTATLLKFGTTSLVLNLVDHDRVPDLELVDPVAALQAISHDPTLATTVALRDGRQLTGWRCSARTWTPARSWSASSPPRVWTRTPRRCSPCGTRCSPTSPRTRPAWPTGWTGPPSTPCSTRTARGTGWRGTIRASWPSTSSTRTCARTRGSTTGWSLPGGCAPSCPPSGSKRLRTPHPRTPARTSAAPRWSATRRPWRAWAGTPSTSPSPASGAVRGSRCPNPGTSPVR